MHTIGIIAEYNPLHTGHIYQINEIKKKYPNSIIIAIINSYFTQRGDISILTKWNKTKIALENKIDIVVELPFAYATQSSDIFAKGALTILNQLGIDTLVFGSESNNIDKLTKIAKLQIKNPEFDKLVKQNLKQGINYPTALNKALHTLSNDEIKEPNDLLGISYIKEILLNNYQINPITIKRIGSYHDKTITTNITNATLIREKIQNKEDISKYLAQNEEKLLIKNISLNNYFPYLKYKIITTKDLSIYQTVDEGIDNRIKKVITTSNSWKELVENIKTKRYTYNKINRMLIHILTSFTKEEAQKETNINYIKLLGFNNTGKKYLNNIKKKCNIPIITSYKKDFSKLLDIDLRIATIYYLPIDEKLIEKEFNKKPIFYDNNNWNIFSI